MCATAAFDALAENYDEQFSARLPVAWLRESVYARVVEYVHTGSWVTELGCGSGDDAIWFAESGCRVWGLDASARMLEKAQSKIEAAGISDAVTLMLTELRQWPAEPEPTGGRADIVFSNFGVLNCVEDLRPIFEKSAAVLKPEGLLIVSVMGRFCLTEFLYFIAKRSVRKATRRWRKNNEFLAGDAHFPVWYHSPASLAASAPDFTRVRTFGIGGLLPTSEAYHLCERMPRLFAALARISHLFSRVLYPVSDHYLMVLRKKPDAR